MSYRFRNLALCSVHGCSIRDRDARRTCPDHAARRQALGPEDRRPDLDDGLYHARSRLHDLRHVVRDRCQRPDQAADDRQVRAFGRQAHLDDDAARRPAVARRHAGHRRGLRCVDQALGREGCDRTEDDVVREGHARRRCEDIPDCAQCADRTRAYGTRQAIVERAIHDAQASRGDKPERPDLRLHGIRTLRVQEGRVEARRQVRLCEMGQDTSRARSPCRVWREARSRKSTASNGSRWPTSRPRSTR